jgi:uncharacterized FlaG/YvyC family protein
MNVQSATFPSTVTPQGNEITPEITRRQSQQATTQQATTQQPTTQQPTTQQSISQQLKMKASSAKNEGNNTHSFFDSKELKPIAKKIQDFFNAMGYGNGLKFEVDEETSRTVVKITDSEGNVMKEIPAKELLDLAAKLAELSEELTGMLYETQA